MVEGVLGRLGLGLAVVVGVSRRYRRQADVDARLAGMMQRALDKMEPEVRWARYTVSLDKRDTISGAWHLPSVSKGGIGPSWSDPPNARGFDDVNRKETRTGDETTDSEDVSQSTVWHRTCFERTYGDG